MHPQYGGEQDPYGNQPYGQHGYAQQGYGGYGQQPYGYPMERPGTVLAVRILTFIAAVVALLFAALFGAAFAIPEVQDGLAAGAADAGLPAGTGIVIVAVALGFFGGYGIISLILGSIGGKRSSGVWWFQILFQGLMLALELLSFVTGGFGAIVFIVYTGVIVLLLSMSSTREWYKG
ncbi:hypothetical protein CLV63_112149 [Murinocardiopsis flavida]|uniref:Uncharacterized protein n=1 Tax=Murinocardiopsis flavida TaxID=645275 RepID=A0A2P8DGE4_9ACTN|nr:hypothetical protein [Murinocardiopsis flavida]PSK96266.1 hypothetical protein CLV63_112149 [Murinocardiopsis flavida]